MQFLLGALMAAAFFLLLIGAYQLGQRNNKPGKEPAEDFELEERREKAKKLQKDFDEMMTYNQEKALKG